MFFQYTIPNTNPPCSFKISLFGDWTTVSQWFMNDHSRDQRFIVVQFSVQHRGHGGVHDKESERTMLVVIKYVGRVEIILSLTLWGFANTPTGANTAAHRYNNIIYIYPMYIG
jgi:hypothetical protein